MTDENTAAETGGEEVYCALIEAEKPPTASPGCVACLAWHGRRSTLGATAPRPRPRPTGGNLPDTYAASSTTRTTDSAKRVVSASRLGRYMAFRVRPRSPWRRFGVGGPIH